MASIESGINEKPIFTMGVLMDRNRESTISSAISNAMFAIFKADFDLIDVCLLVTARLKSAFKQAHVGPHEESFFKWQRTRNSTAGLLTLRSAATSHPPTLDALFLLCIFHTEYQSKTPRPHGRLSLRPQLAPRTRQNGLARRFVYA